METKKIVKFIILAVLAITLLVGVFGSFAVVPPGHRGILVVLGSVNPNFLPEGLNFKYPIVSEVIPISIKQETRETVAVAFSSDLQTINMKVNCLWRPPEQNIVQLYQKYSGAIYPTVIEPRIQEQLKQITALHKAEELVKSREKVKVLCLEKVRAQLKELVIIEDIVINNVDLTPEMEKSIEQKQIMEQLALAKTYELQKEQKEAEITVVKAKAEAESVKIKGEALLLAPMVIQLEIVKKWNGVCPQYLSTTGEGANIILPVK